MEYVTPDWLSDFNGYPPPFQGSSATRPGGTPIGAGTGSGSWGPAQQAVVPLQGGGPIIGGGMQTPSSSWLPTSMLKRGL